MVPVSLDAVRPHLPRTLTTAETARANAWVQAMNVLVTAQYGRKVDDHMTRTGQDIMPLIHSYVANAIERRLSKKNRMADAEGSGPFSVRWNSRSGLFNWFMPEEIAELNSVLGTTGTRTYRTPAPDKIIRAASGGYVIPTGEIGGVPLENYWIDGGEVD